MKKMMIMALLLIPNVCYAGVPDVLRKVFCSPESPGYAVAMLVGLEFGQWLVEAITSVFGKGDKWLKFCFKTAKATVVIGVVWGFAEATFRLIGW